jgi:arylsulfatase
LPLDGRAQERIAERKPQIAEVRERYTYYPGGQSIPESVAVDVKNRSHTITAEVEIPDEGAEGVLLAMGSRFGGYSLFVKDRRLHYVHNYVGVEEYRITSAEEVPAGMTSLRYVFTFDGGAPGSGGTGELYFNGRKVGEGRIPRTVPITFTLAGEGLCCGWDGGEPVSAEYESPFRFTGHIRRVIVDVSGVAPRDLEAEMDMALSRQ